MELKQCPFCRSAPHKPRKIHDGPYVHFEIECCACTATVTDETEEGVVKAWNNRAGKDEQ